LDLPTGSFDRCFSLLALNFVSHPIQAIAAMARIVRPGGVIAAAVWDFVGGLVYQRIFWDTAAALDPEADLARGRHFSRPLIGPNQLTDAFDQVRLCGVQAATLAIHMEYANFLDYWEPIANAQGPVGDYVKRLSPERLETLVAAVRGAYLSGAADGPRSIAATAWAARGVVPNSSNAGENS
jgi:SAM-dependent methyltransferase